MAPDLLASVNAMKTEIIALIGLGTMGFAVAYSTMSFPVCHYAGECPNSCINILRQIDGAKQQYSLETRRTNGTVEFADISQYLKSDVHCPSGGIYTYGKLGELPVCSITNAFPGVKERVGSFGWRWKIWPSGGPHKLPPNF